MRRWPIAGLTVAALLSAAPASASEDTYSGSDMWLHYVPVSDAALLASYRAAVSSIVVENAEHDPVHRQTADLGMESGASEKPVRTSLEAARDELARGLGALLDSSTRRSLNAASSSRTASAISSRNVKPPSVAPSGSGTPNDGARSRPPVVLNSTVSTPLPPALTRRSSPVPGASGSEIA